jgi:hypothetical protein
MITAKRPVLRSESHADEVFDPQTITALGLGEQLFLDDRVTVNKEKFREVCSLIGLRNLAVMSAILSDELEEQLAAKL